MTVKSVYYHLIMKDNQVEVKENTHVFWKRLWGSDLIPKWKNFIWKLINRALPTMENLEKEECLWVEGVFFVSLTMKLGIICSGTAMWPLIFGEQAIWGLLFRMQGTLLLQIG